MRKKDELINFHKENEEKYLGKNTDKGIIERVEYLTFNNNSGGNYHKLPQLGGKGLIVGVIGKKAFPIGELKFI